MNILQMMSAAKIMSAWLWHHISVMMSQITYNSTGGSTAFSGFNQWQHQSSALLVFIGVNPPVTGGFPSQRASNEVSIPKSWCHRVHEWEGQNFPPGKMSSYQYRKSHCGDKMVVRSSYIHNGISYTGKMASLYWFSPLDSLQDNHARNVFNEVLKSIFGQFSGSAIFLRDQLYQLQLSIQLWK